MKAMVYLERMDQPVSILEDVRVVAYEKPNHAEASQIRIFYRTGALNAGKTMVELHRDRKMTLKLEDGRTAQALLTHTSLDMEGYAVGVFRVLGDLE